MARRTYPVDEHAEAVMDERLSHLWRTALLKFPRWSKIDRVAVRNDGGCWALVEYKGRKRDREYDKAEVMLSIDKWIALMHNASAMHVTPLLAVRFADGAIRWADMTDLRPTRLGMGGRTDRNDPDDLEPCAWFAIDKMTRVARR